LSGYKLADHLAPTPVELSIEAWRCVRDAVTYHREYVVDRDGDGDDRQRDQVRRLLESADGITLMISTLLESNVKPAALNSVTNVAIATLVTRAVDWKRTLAAIRYYGNRLAYLSRRSLAELDVTGTVRPIDDTFELDSTAATADDLPLLREASEVIGAAIGAPANARFTGTRAEART